MMDGCENMIFSGLDLEMQDPAADLQQLSPNNLNLESENPDFNEEPNNVFFYFFLFPFFLLPLMDGPD